MYVCIYIYIERERQIDRDKDRETESYNINIKQYWLCSTAPEIVSGVFETVQLNLPTSLRNGYNFISRKLLLVRTDLLLQFTDCGMMSRQVVQSSDE